jgi:hypothetical protein
VVLPLEIQMKDHKAQLQSRLDSLAKINEKTTSINEQMAMLRAAEQDLKRQRDMIDGLIMRVREHGSHPVLAESPPAPTPRQDVPVEFLKTARVPVADEPAEAKPAAAGSVAAPKPAAPRPAAERPMVADDAFAFLDSPKEKPGLGDTQRLDAAFGERTQQIPALDPNYRPEKTQSMPAAKVDPAPAPEAAPGENTGTVPGAETTQRLGLSIQRLQEAKKLLQKQ